MLLHTKTFYITVHFQLCGDCLAKACTPLHKASSIKTWIEYGVEEAE